MTPVRLLAIIEALTITGPAKNLIQFARLAHSGQLDFPIGVDLACFERGVVGSNPFIDTVRSAGIPLHFIPGQGRVDRATLAVLSELVDRLAPAIVQTHAVKAHFLTRLAGVHHKRPWVAFHHGYTWPDFRVRLYNQLDRWSLRVPVRVLTVSREFKAELARNGVAGDKIEVIHNAIDPDWGRRPQDGHAVDLRARLAIPAGKRIVLIVGRLSREKDHFTLLHALRRVREKVPAAHLLIVGDGPERANIEAATARLGLRADVTLAGQTSSAEPFYPLASLAVLSSLSEGSPNALLEAMAARIPVVATAVGGIPEIVADGDSALLVRPGDAAAMASAIGRLLDDDSLAIRLAGRAHDLVVERHSPLARARRLCEVYARVLSR